MIVFIKADGTVINVAPSPVYQGSSLSGSLYLVAPYPSTNSATVQFTLPNGDRTENYVLTAVSLLQDVVDKLGDNYSVWEWQVKNGQITALSGTVTAQFAILFNGQIQTTSSVNFTVQEGVLPLPPTEPTADQWELLIELYGNLAGRVAKLEQLPNTELVDFTCELIEKNGVGYYKYTKTYSSGSVVFFEVPIPNTSEGIAIEDGVVIIEFSEDSVWGQDNSGYSLGFSPSQTTYDTAEYQVQLFEQTTSGGKSGWSSVADSVFVGSDGSLLITANEPYSGRIVIDGSKAYTNFANLLNEAVEQSQEAVEQSQEAVEQSQEAIDGLNKKLDKVTTSSSQKRVYAIDIGGKQILLETGMPATPETLPRRAGDGNFDVNCDNPAKEERCANLKWVKNYVANNTAGILELVDSFPMVFNYGWQPVDFFAGYGKYLFEVYVEFVTIASDYRQCRGVAVKEVNLTQGFDIYSVDLDFPSYRSNDGVIKKTVPFIISESSSSFSIYPGIMTAEDIDPNAPFLITVTIYKIKGE